MKNSRINYRINWDKLASAKGTDVWVPGRHDPWPWHLGVDAAIEGFQTLQGISRQLGEVIVLRC